MTSNPSLARDDIGHEPFVAGPILAHDDDGLAHRRAAAQAPLRSRRARSGIPEASPGSRCAPGTRVLRRAQPRHVAGAVHPAFARERIGQESFGRQLGPLPVTANDALPAQEQLARLAVRDGLSLGSRT